MIRLPRLPALFFFLKGNPSKKSILWSYGGGGVTPPSLTMIILWEIGTIFPFLRWLGHSCKIGNEPVLAWKKMKTMFGVFSIYICFLFEVLSMKKAITNLNIFSGTFSPLNFMVPVSLDDEGILDPLPPPPPKAVSLTVFSLRWLMFSLMIFGCLTVMSFCHVQHLLRSGNWNLNNVINAIVRRELVLRTVLWQRGRWRCCTNVTNFL